MSRRLLLLCVAIVPLACGASGDSGPSQTPDPSPSPLGPPTTTITAAGVDPQVLHTFNFQETVVFVNGDSQAHDIRSDPHPSHSDCAAMNLGTLAPGERREIAGPTLPRFTLCYYHDEIDPANTAFRGVVVTH
jgi:hypothetical protein